MPYERLVIKPEKWKGSDNDASPAGERENSTDWRAAFR